MDFLRELLGDELYAQVEAKLSGNDQVRLANVADGSYMPRDKYNTLNTEVKSLKKEMSKKDLRITDLERESEQQGKDFAISGVLTKAGAKNIKAVKALLDHEKIVYKEGKVSGLQEQVDSLVKNEGYLFGQAAPQKPVVNPPGAGNVATQNAASAMNSLIRNAAGKQV